MALGDVAGLLGVAAQGEQVEVAGDELHARQPLPGALEVQAAGDDRRRRHDLPVVAEQRDEAELRLAALGALGDLDRAVLVLLDARLDQVLERLQCRGAHFGGAVIGADVGDRAREAVLFSPASRTNPAASVPATTTACVVSRSLMNAGRFGDVQQPLHERRAARRRRRRDRAGGLLLPGVLGILILFDDSRGHGHLASDKGERSFVSIQIPP